jgi:RNA polymerase sigma-70 factor (ECF subfamily)
MKGEMRREEDYDIALVGRSLNGDGRAFGKLIRRHHDLVFSVVRGIMGRRDDVEDVAQEVFIKIFKSLSGFRGEAKLATWIYRIARNEAINAVSRSRPTLETLDESRGDVSSARSPEEQLERKNAKHLLDEMLAALDENHRIAIELRYMGGKSYVEIAEIMEIPMGTVKTYIYRAKAAMKKRLSVIQSREETI